MSAAFSIEVLTINGGTLSLGTNSGASTVTSLTITGSGALNVANNGLFIDFSGADPVSTIAGYLTSGYNGGAWTGAGINSSAAATTSGYALGYADGSDGVVSGLSAGQIEIRYTLYGDAELNGSVTGNDFTILSSNLGKSLSGWDEGDFDYAGDVSGDDFTLLVSNFGKSAIAADIALPAMNLASTETTVTPTTTLKPVILAPPSAKILSTRPFQASNVSFHPSKTQHRGRIRPEV